MAIPDKIYIPYEESEYARFDCVGQMPDGTQFMAFVTGAFPADEEGHQDWGRGGRKQWLAVIHRFDADGNHLGSEARSGGLDKEGKQAATEHAEVHLDALLASLAQDGVPVLCGIWARPFSVMIDGVRHGLIYEQSEEEDLEEGEEREEWVLLDPQDIMFPPPWDDGEYST